jgi:O-antigen ligase
MNIHQNIDRFPSHQKTAAVRNTTPINTFEIGVAIFIIVFPVMGTFFAPETYFSPQDFSIQGAAERETGFPFGRIAYFLMILCEMYLFIRVPNSFMRGARRAILPLAYVVWTLITGTWTADPGASMNRSFRLLILCVFAVYLAERFGTKQLLRIIAISGGAAIIATVIAVVALPQYGLTTLIGYEGAWRGATLHKNALGSLMALVFSFSWFAYSSKIVGKKTGIFLLLGSLFEILMARSMTALITAAVAFCLIHYFRFIMRLQGAAEKSITLILGIFLLVGMYIAQSMLEALLEALGRSSDFTGRKDVWEFAWYLIGRNPIWGYGSGFWSIDSPDRAYAWRSLGWAPPHSHNNFLDIWLQLGLPGLFLMSAILLICLSRIITLLLQGKTAVNLVWPIIVIAIIFGGLTETNLVDANAAPFWLTLAFLKMKKFILNEPSA